MTYRCIWLVQLLDYCYHNFWKRWFPLHAFSGEGYGPLTHEIYAHAVLNAIHVKILPHNVTQ